MLFSSVEFVFFFFPVVVAGYWILQKYKLDSYKSAWLLLSSIGFYAFWQWQDLIPLTISAYVNYYIYKTMADHKYQTQYLVGGILFNLLFLAWYKYPILFFRENSSGIPLGISFYTFTQIAFLIDGYKQHFKHLTFPKYALFVGYFPHLICGPILIFKDFYPQLLQKSQMKINMDNVIYFLFFFSMGLFKKTFIADPLGLYVSSVFDVNAEIALSFHTALLATLCYSFQLYADFSGYTDMAVGLSRLFGITIPFNFNSPYQATSIIEFWRRWHMSLSNFLKNYLYIPLGGNRTTELRYTFNLIIVMAIGGIWHGSSFTFLIWGMYHGVLLVLNHQQRKFVSKMNLSCEGAQIWMHGFKVLSTFLLVSLGWVIFRSQDMNQALGIFRSLLLSGNEGLTLYFSTKWQYIAILFGLSIAFILPETHKMYLTLLSYEGAGRRMAKLAFPFAGAVSGILLAVGILLLNKPHQFLYSGF
ncbi:MAG: MBOAT family protein [Alphaproteobacteria bacterium]|jgi:alginate O-acetyltransferase complex protein AlgI|nr:MBOAT family protein [Alphaproteobacteria bacterium]